MTAGTELLAVERQLAIVLAFAGAAGVYNNQAPLGAVYPYVVFSAQPGTVDVQGIGTARVFVEARYLVKVVSRTDSPLTAATILAALDTLMRTSLVGSNPSGVIYGAMRETPVEYAETIDGVQYWHQGGIYRIYAQ